MRKSDLIARLVQELTHLEERDAELAVKAMLARMTAALAAGERIEIRGFGSFSLHFRPPRMGRNPKTGETVSVAARYVPHFKPGKELRERVRGTQDIGRRTPESVRTEPTIRGSSGDGNHPLVRQEIQG